MHSTQEADEESGEEVEVVHVKIQDSGGFREGTRAFWRGPSAHFHVSGFQGKNFPTIQASKAEAVN
jgi:hypothetical protein